MHPVNEFGLVYRRLLSDLLNKDHAVVEFNERTRTNVAVLPGGTSFQLNLQEGKLPTCGLRQLHPRTAAAEIAWFLKGSDDVTWLEERDVRIWSNFAEAGTVANAYGYRWRRAFGRDQVGKAVETLKRDASDRQCFISAWDPGKDGCGNRGKNFPCPVGFTLHIINGQLHSTLLLRSSDVFVGLPYDVMGHAMLMAILAGWIDKNLSLGTMTVTLAHPHMYDAHWEMAQQCLRRPSIAKTDISLLQITQDRPDWDHFINMYHQSARKQRWPDFNPRPRLVL